MIPGLIHKCFLAKSESTLPLPLNIIGQVILLVVQNLFKCLIFSYDVCFVFSVLLSLIHLIYCMKGN